MATNIFTSVNTELVGNLFIDSFVSALAPLNAFSMNATNQVAYRGDSVRVLLMGTGSSALDYTTAYSMQNSKADGIDVALDKHKYVSLELYDSEWRDSALLNVETFVRSKASALAKSVMTDIMSTVSSSFGAETLSVTTGSGFNHTAVVAVSTECDTRLFPEYFRSLVLTPAQHSCLRTDVNIASSYAFGSPEIIRTGQVPSLDTFSYIYKTSVIPDVSKCVGFACYPSAVAFASRVVSAQDPNQYNDISVFTDEQTGLSITQKLWHNPDAGSRRVVWECEYGVKAGNPDALFLLIGP